MSPKLYLPLRSLAQERTLQSAPSRHLPSSTLALLAAWIGGATLFLLPVMAGLWQVRSLRRAALPWRHGQSFVDALALEAGIHRRVELLLHHAMPGPMTCGVARPAIVLNYDAQTWDEADLTRAIIHELEHVRRGDWLSHCLARAVCAVYWFHPLVWIAWRHLVLEAERSCDDSVLRRTDATAYADQLVGLARRLSGATKTASKSPLLAMANRADLAKRVAALLDSRQRRGRAGKASIALACAGAAALVLTMSPLRLVAAFQSRGTDTIVAPTTTVVAFQAPAKNVKAEAIKVATIKAASIRTIAAFQTRAVAGPSPVPHFLANTRLVIADVTVRDNDGNTVEGLSAGDFVITEDGVPQMIAVFEFQKLHISSPATQDSSYYILGYYPSNFEEDDKFRQIRIVGKQGTMAKLDYRAGYYLRGRAIAGPPDSASRTGIGQGVEQSAITQGSVNRGSAPSSTPPQVMLKFEAEYSEEARKAKWQGTVELSLEVDASGQPADIQVTHPLGLGLDQKALDAVARWKFKPGTQDGKPVTMQTQVTVNFRLL